MDDELRDAQDLTAADLARMLDGGDPADLGDRRPTAGIVVTPDRFSEVTVHGCRLGGVLDP